MHYQKLTRAIEPDNRTKKFEDDGYKIFWEGFLFVKGLTPGEESLAKLVEELKQKSIHDVCDLLQGVFACIVHDEKKDIIYSFSDNIGLFNLFESENFVTTSLLDSIKLNQLGKSDIDPSAIIDFIITTACMRWKTFFDSINKTQFNDIIVDNGSTIKLEKKNLQDIFYLTRCEGNIIKRFEPIAVSLSKLKGRISMDLSGGLDTRLISTLLNYYGVDFETAISGMPGNLDIEISKKVAEAMGKEHYITYHQVNPNAIEKELDEAFELYDACMDIVSWHRGYQFQKDKVKRNCILTITGHAGELYKNEFIWATKNDDPKATIDRLVSLNNYIRYGMKFDTIPHQIFTDEYKKHSMSYKDRITNYLLETYGQDKSGKTGPKIYVYFQEGSRTTNMGSFVDRYSPLLDRDIIPCGITLKLSKMTLKDGLKRTIFQPWDDRSTFQRKIITYLNPKVANINTTYTMGYSASTKRTQVIKRYLHYYRQKHSSKPKEIRPISSLNPEFFPTIRSLEKTQEMLELLKNERILNNNVKVEDIGNEYLGSVFTVGKLIDYCDKLN